MYKGQLKDFPREVVEKMLERQVEQGNVRNVKVFEEKAKTSISNGGFDWKKSNEGYVFWYSVINDKTFDVFFAKYPQTAEEGTAPKISHDIADVIHTKEFGKINQGHAKCDESNECVTTDEDARIEAAKKAFGEDAEKINQEKAKDSEIASLKKQLETSEELYRVLEQRYDNLWESNDLLGNSHDELLKERNDLKQRCEELQRQLDTKSDETKTVWNYYHAEVAKVSQLQAELTAIKVIVNKF